VFLRLQARARRGEDVFGASEKGSVFEPHRRLPLPHGAFVGAGDQCVKLVSLEQDLPKLLHRDIFCFVCLVCRGGVSTHSELSDAH
jgi:hypothetical protein